MFESTEATRKVAPIRIDSVSLNEIPFPAVILKNDRIVSYNKVFFNEFCELDLTNARRFIEHFQGASWERIEENQYEDAEFFFCQSLGKYYQIKCSDVFRSGELKPYYFTDVTKIMMGASQNVDQREALFAHSSSFSVMEMSTTLAHELNQPLATITNFVNVALAVHDAEPDKRKLLPTVLDKIKNQAEHAAVIISRVREFVEHKSPHWEPSQIEQLIEDALDTQRLSQSFLPVVVHTEIEPGLPTVICDRVMIHQVLGNLLRNACDAMTSNAPTARCITLKAKRMEDNRVQVCVQDNGIGVAEEDQSKVFQSFFTTKENGMGAGLAICRSFIELHQGQLTFQSSPGEGCEFCFSLMPYLGES